METIKKIIVLGPVYPYKGGISHYTSRLHAELSLHYEVDMFSFNFQYPKFLYPGEEQKDFSNDLFKVADTKYLMNSINPFNWVKTAKKIIKDNPDLLIIQWWNPFFAPLFISLAWIVKKFSDIKVLSICHNVLPHEKILFDRFFTKVFLSQIDFAITHSKEDKITLLNIQPSVKCKLAVHPTYSVFKRSNISQEEARKTIGSKKQKVLLFFGFIREYKGLMTLIEAMPEILEDSTDIELFVVGDFYVPKKKYYDRVFELNLENNVRFVSDYIPDNEIEKYFIASDLVILPYNSATQSGIVQIAFGFEKPVIVTNVGGLAEIVKDGITGFVISPKDKHDLAVSVKRFFDEDCASEFSENIKHEVGRFSWEKMVETIEELWYEG